MERNILRKQRLNEIAKKEKMINNDFFKEYFEYSSLSNMYKNLNTSIDIEENKTKVNKIKKNLTGLMIKIKIDPTNYPIKIGNKNNMVETVKLILKFNQLEQEGSDLKILTPNQMLSRLLISLQIKKTKKMFIKVWLTLFKHGNNLHEH